MSEFSPVDEHNIDFGNKQPLPEGITPEQKSEALGFVKRTLETSSSAELGRRVEAANKFPMGDAEFQAALKTVHEVREALHDGKSVTDLDREKAVELAKKYGI